MDKILAFDEQLFWWINSHHTSWLDWILWVFSQSWSWMMVMVALLIMVFGRDRKSWLWLVLGMALCFLLADQISNIIKDGVMRLRPCHALDNVRMFHTNKGGQYGFVSSHAANAFALAMYISLCYGGGKRRGSSQANMVKPNPKWIKSIICNTGNGWQSPLLPWLMMPWAAVVGYSRPYLGKHYPGDVFCGALLGLGLGALAYFVISKIRAKVSSAVVA